MTSDKVYAGDTESATGKEITISDGNPFAGRKAGGGTRDQIFGTTVYGSGYPGQEDVHGVAGRDFPFFYWPVVWTPAAFNMPGRPSLPAYIHLADEEYGPPSNDSRPGGPLTTIFLPSLDSTTRTSFRLISDNYTITTLLPTLRNNCASHLSMFTDIHPKAFDNSFPIPKPEDVVQYYRGSSIALCLDGYNNTQVLMRPREVDDATFPLRTDIALMSCLNSTIGSSAPLVGDRVNAAPSRLWTDDPMSGMGVSLIFVGVWWFFAML
ncbi:hypothetical protein BDQ17DRAFT_1262609 [Cyathus striatus]|nr:hypothetical protein BDQ17DRAFT_1262609 [Cyathus striatus]